jgi:hypothetical protein
MGIVLLEIGVALHDRLGVQREKEIRGSAAQGIAKETWRRNAYDRK